MIRRPPLLAEVITEKLSAAPSTRMALAQLSERQLREALMSDHVQPDEILPHEEKLFIPKLPLFFPVIHNLDSWAPQRYSSQVHLYPATVSYENGGYVIRPRVGSEYRINAAAPSGDLRRSRGATVSLRRAAIISSLSIYYPIRFPLSELIPRRFVLESAMHRLLQRGPTPGVDGVSIHRIKNHVEFIDDVQSRFLENRLNPKPLRQKLIPKIAGRFRKLAIPSVRDHLIQAAIFEVLAPYTETYFLPCSFGFRPGRNAIDAIQGFRKFLDEGFRWVVAIDIKDFFDSIAHPVLRRILKQDLRGDWRLVTWIMSQAKAKLVTEKGELVKRERGVPQGGPLSPLLGNMVLHRLDVWAKHKGFRMVRFADDITFLARKKSGGEKILTQAKEFLQTHCDLSVNINKSGIYDAHTESVSLLGFDIDKGVVQPSKENIEICKASLLEIFSSSSSAEEKTELFYRSARSWGQYFRRAFFDNAAEELEKWIRTIEIKDHATVKIRSEIGIDRQDKIRLTS